MQKCARVHQAWAAPLGAVFPGFFLGTLQLSGGGKVCGDFVLSLFSRVSRAFLAIVACFFEKRCELLIFGYR